MVHSRRNFMKTAAATAALAAAPVATAAPTRGGTGITPQQVTDLFEDLPGDKALKVFAPVAAGKPEFLAQINSDKMLFVASAIKTFVLCEALRQADSADVDEKLEKQAVALDSSVWSFGSPTFNPPNLSGVVSERTTLEAMITRSDNTATDMAFKLVGTDNVRQLIASAGLKRTLVPESTRAFTGYLFGARDYKNLSWQDLQEVVEGPIVNPFLNNVQTLASSADDLVSYYSRALQGKFFRHRETLDEFRRILTLCDFIYLVPLPLGVSAYAKSGNADTSDFHARSLAGGIFFGDRWVYFAFIINWFAKAAEDPGTVRQFFSAVNQALTLVRDAL